MQYLTAVCFAVSARHDVPATVGTGRSIQPGPRSARRSGNPDYAAATNAVLSAAGDDGGACPGGQKGRRQGNL